MTVSSAVSLQQGGINSYLAAQVNPINGFAGTVSISLQGLPAGITTIPSSALQVSPNGLQSYFELSAGAAALVSVNTVTVVAASGSLSHSASVSLTITAAAQYTISLSPATISLAPGEFVDVQVIMTSAPGGPSDAMVNLPSPPSNNYLTYFMGVALVTTSQPRTFRVSASPLAQPLVDFPVVVSASKNTDTSITTLRLNVSAPFVSRTTLTRSTFAGTDMEVDAAVYDPVRKLVFATAMLANRVYVFSSIDSHRVASIPVLLPRRIELSADGRRVYVTSQSNFLSVIDPDTLQVIERVPGPPIALPLGSTVAYGFPHLIAATANGTCLVITGYVGRSSLYLWDPAAGSWTPRSPGFSSTVSMVARSGDYSKLFVSSGADVSIYDVASDTFSTPQTINAGFGTVAVNEDGSQIAVNAVSELFFYDGQLNELARREIRVNAEPGGVVYSRDGRFLYLSQWYIPNAALVAVYDTQTFNLVGLVPQMIVDMLSPEPLAIDENAQIFGKSKRGLAFVDASTPRAIGAHIPVLRFPNALSPPQAAIDTNVPINVSGVWLNSANKIFFGPQEAPLTSQATAVTSPDSSNLFATAPSSSTPGPVHVTVTNPDGSFTIAPDGFTYGPHILTVNPSAGSPAGGTSVVISGYGFAFPANQMSVRIGGQPAPITSVNSVFADTFFPKHEITVTSPAGQPGLADVVVTTPAGTFTAPSAYQYLRRATVFPVKGALSQVIYDRNRARLFASNFVSNRVEVLSLASGQYQAAIPAGALPEGVALTPDGARLVIANFGDNTITIVDPDAPANSSTVQAAPPSGCGERPVRVVTALPRLAIIQINCRNEIGGFMRLFDVDALSFSCGSSAACSTFLSSFGSPDIPLAATPDGRTVLAVQGYYSPGFLEIWDVVSDTLIQARAQGTIDDVAAADDANLFAINPLFHDAVLRDLGAAVGDLHTFNYVYGQKLHPSGALYYRPTDKGVDIFDVHTGSFVLRVASPDPVAITLDALALDEHGRRMFLVTDSGITILEIELMPIGIGSISPAQGPAAGGPLLTIRGSGFQSGAVVKFGNTQVSANFVDESTLTVSTPLASPGPVRVTIVNPDGRQYSLDAAFLFL